MRPTSLLLMLALSLCALVQANGSNRVENPVQFEFGLPRSEANPFARVVWAEVVHPSGRVLDLPVFYLGGGRHAVRARPVETGRYRLGRITEEIEGIRTEVKAVTVKVRRANVKNGQAHFAIRIDPDDPRGFIRGASGKFVPVGANLAWPDETGVRFYEQAFEAFSAQKLNWTRIWMAHWSGLNLDWVPERSGPSPRDGTLDLRVAADWDRIVDLASASGVYFQWVLQHHGQYSSEVNSNWKENPWNQANGGFLKAAADFFTSPEAERLTRQKYRYIVARWGWSSAIMSWELFNEVHWTDAMRGAGRDEAAVARWHSRMAAYLRSIDRYGHLVTTSTENLHSPVYADLDYYQPHLYAPNLLAGVRRFSVSPADLSKPVFHGEVGDDHLPVEAAIRQSGVTLLPPVWASLLGQGRYPAQAWLGRDLLEKGLLPGLGAIADYVHAAGPDFFQAADPFFPGVECESKVPFLLPGGQVWQPDTNPELETPIDGREPFDFARIPRIYMNPVESRDNGYPSRVTHHVDLPSDCGVRFQIQDSATSAGAFRFSVDGVAVSEANWPDLPEGGETKGPRPQRAPDAVIPAGRHVLVVENPADKGWFDLAAIEFGHEVPVLAAVGRRNKDAVALWVWHRSGVFAAAAGAPVQGGIMIDELPAGRWSVTWWDSAGKKSDRPVVFQHPGGAYRLMTPPVGRHAAALLKRL